MYVELVLGHLGYVLLARCALLHVYSTCNMVRFHPKLYIPPYMHLSVDFQTRRYIPEVGTNLSCSVYTSQDLTAT